jgi:uncharacterized membrane protein
MMRNTRDRLRHAIGFELIGLLIAAPLASWVTGVGLNHMGPLALFFSVVATVWNYVYNIGVDRLLLRLQGHTHKSLWQRVLHTLIPSLCASSLKIPLWLSVMIPIFFIISSSFVIYFYNVLIIGITLHLYLYHIIIFHSA